MEFDGEDGADGAVLVCKYIWESFFKKVFSSAYDSQKYSIRTIDSHHR